MVGELVDVLISYSRKDEAFARRLSEALTKSDHSTWIDWKNIPLTAKWLAEIESAIEAAHTFVFVISPDSIASEVCRAEIHHAAQRGKRFIGVVHRDVDPKTAPPELAEWQWLFFRAQDDFESACQSLIAAIETDLGYVRLHTRLLVRSREWEDKSQNRSFLLRGKDLDEAKTWLDASVEKKPPPTALHRLYIQAGYRARARQGRARAGIGIVVALLMFVAYGYFLQARQRASISRHDAYATSLNLAERAHLDRNYSRAVELLQQQNPKAGEEDLREFAWRHLWRLYDNDRHTLVTGETTSIALSPDGQTLAVTNRTRTTTLWDVLAGKPLRKIEDAEEEVTTASFAREGTALATKTQDGAVKLSSIVRPEEKTRTLNGRFYDMAVSPDGNILFGKVPQSLKWVNLESGTEHPVEDLNAHGDIAGWSFSPDGRTFAVAYQFNAVRLFDSTDGTLSGQIDPGSGIGGMCWKDSTVLAVGVSGNRFHEVVLWDLKRNTETLRLRGPAARLGQLVSIACHPGGRMVSMLVGSATILSPQQGNQLIAWDANNGRRLFTLGEEETGFVTALQFSPDGAMLATGSRDYSVRLWNSSTGTLRNVLGIHHGSWTREQQGQGGRQGSGVSYVTQNENGSGISQVLYSRDGKTLVTASRVQGTVKIWNTDVAPDNHHLPQRPDHHTAMAFSPDGKRIVTGDRDGTIVLWNATDHSNVAEVSGHLTAIEGLAFSPNADTFASSGDGTVKLWRTDSLEQQAVFADDSTSQGLSTVELFLNDRVLVLVRRDLSDRKVTMKAWDLAAKRKPIAVQASLGAMAAGGSKLASIADCRIVVWDLVGWTSEVIFGGKPCSTLESQLVALSPGGSYLAVGRPEAGLQRDGKTNNPVGGIHLFHLAGPKHESILPLSIGFDNTTALRSLQFSPDGKLLAAVSAPSNRNGAAVTVWNVARREEVATLPQPTSDVCNGFVGASCRRIGAFSPDSQTLALIGGPSLPTAGANEITLWHLNTQAKETVRSNHRVDRLLFSPDGETFATVISSNSGEPTVLWSMRSGREVGALGNYQAEIQSINSASDGRVLAASYEYPASTSILAKVWNLATGRLLAVQPQWGVNLAGPATFSPAGHRLAVRRGDDGVLVWDLDRGETVSTLNVAQVANQRTTTSFSPDGSLAVTNTEDHVAVWDLSRGKVLQEFLASPPIAFDPTGKTLATTTECKTVRLWDIATGRLQADFSANTKCLQRLCFSPDGKMLVSLGPAEARLWDVRTGKSSTSLTGYDVEGFGIAAFAPDGKTVATAGRDGNVNLWDPVTGRRLFSLPGPKQAITGLEFLPAGEALLVGYVTEVRSSASFHARER